MFAADAVAAPSIQAPLYGCKVGRSYSSSAAYIAKARSRFLVGDTQRTFIDSEPFQTKIGAIFESSLPQDVTGLIRKTPALIITVDGSPTELTRNIISVANTVTKEEKTAAISFKNQIESIQSELGLSITQLAQLFGVTRKSVYDWLDNAAPRANISNRMELISTLVRSNNSKLDLKRLKGVWLINLDGRSFLDVILDDALDYDSRMAAAIAKLDELAPRLGEGLPKLGKTYLGNAHASDVERVADLG